jgi:hypothetical protein
MTKEYESPYVRSSIWNRAGRSRVEEAQRTEKYLDRAAMLSIEEVESRIDGISPSDLGLSQIEFNEAQSALMAKLRF